ncbi:hypothetical protein LCGC14_1233030 [marine sediment metagenome]|uniref:Uncharacterized protein n=1 Tax=marine sediment metagenome TaxID=412755 RepID=A0A0F9NQ77_9ZZZZ
MDEMMVPLNPNNELIMLGDVLYCFARESDEIDESGEPITELVYDLMKKPNQRMAGFSLEDKKPYSGGTIKITNHLPIQRIVVD